MNYVTIREAAEMLGVSHMTVRRKLKKLRSQLIPHVKVNNGVTMITHMGITVINNSINKPAKTVNKADSHDNNSDSHVNSNITEFLKDQIHHKDEIIKGLLQEQAEKDRRHDVLIQQLTGQIKEHVQMLEDLRKQVEKPVQKPKTPKNKVVSLKKRAGGEKKQESHPSEKWGYFKKSWIQFFEPWKLREDYKEKKSA